MEDNSRDKLGVAIVGCGYWGINYVRVFTELPQVGAVTACDQRPERLEEIRQRFPGATLVTDVGDALRSEEVDVAVVATPATTHYDVTRRCLEAGKHVLVEKPITIKSSEAEELIELAETKGLTLMVGHTFLYNAGVQKVKSYIEKGETGQLYYLYAQRTNLGPIRDDVNALWDLAPHDVSIFNYWLSSRPSWVSAIAGRVLQNCFEDYGFISLGYQDGIVGHIHASWTDPHKVRETVVVGSDKRIVFDDVRTMEQVRVFDKGVSPAAPEAPSYGEYRFLLRDGDIISPKVEVSEPLRNQCRHFLDCVTQGIRPLSDGQAGLEVVQVMEAIDRSIELNGTPVSLPENGTSTAIPQNGKMVSVPHDGTVVSISQHGKPDAVTFNAQPTKVA